MRRALLLGAICLASAGVSGAGEMAIVSNDWTPTQSDAEHAVAVLTAFLSSAHRPELWGAPPESAMQRREREAVLSHLPTYKLRITGEISKPQPNLVGWKPGRRLLRVSGFCETFGDGWRNPGYYMMDGGDCYFTADYDPKANSMVWFSINGGSR